MQAKLMNDIEISGSSELGTKDTGGEVFLSQFPVSVNASECNGMESVTKEDGMGLDGSAEMVEKIVGEEGENLMDDILDREEGDLLLPRSGSVDGIQVNQDAEDRIPSPANAKSTGDGIQDDPDGEETLAKFKRPRRSKKSAVKDALEDDIGNEVAIPRDKDESSSKDKPVRESDGENLMDNTQADPDGEEGDCSSPKSKSVLDDIQVIQDAEENIWSMHKAKSIGDGMQDDLDGQETLVKFKRLRRSKKTAVKVALEDDVGNEMEVPIDMDKSSSKEKAVRESYGESLTDGIQADPDGEEGDHSSPKSRSVVDGMQAIQDAEESIPSPVKAKSIGDGMQADSDGQETLPKFKRLRRSKKAAVKVALQDDVGKEMEVPIDKDKSLSKEKAVRESDGENTMDDIQADPDGEEGDHASPKSRSVVDGMQTIQDAEENIPSPPKAKSIGDGMRADSDGQETLPKFKRLRRSKKAAVKVALQDDVGNEMEVLIDKDKSLSKDKAVRESDGENLMDDIQADPDGEEGDHASPKSRSVVDGMQTIQDAEENIPSPPKAKSIGDGMRADSDGQETLPKFKRLRRSKKAAVKVALQDDVGNEMEVLIDKDKSLSKDKAVRESDGENLMDDIQAYPDGEEGDRSSPKSRSVVDGMQAIQDAEESIPSPSKAKSIGDSMRADSDGQETLPKFKRLRRSKKAAVKVALQDDVGNKMEVPIDKDKSLSKDKAVRESDGENLMDDIQADPDGEEGDHSPPKSRSVVDGMQDIQDAEENIWSLPKAKSIGDGMQVDPDGPETVAKFKRLHRSKKAVVKVALEDDIGNKMEVPKDKDKSLLKDKAVQESDDENLLDNIQADPDGEEGDNSFPKPGSVVDDVQVTGDVEESIPLLRKSKSIGDDKQDDPDGEETLAKFKRPRRSKKAAVKVALEDDIGNKMEVAIDKYKRLLKDKAVGESDGENLLDNIQADPDREVGDHSLPKSGSVVDGIQVTENVEESILSLSKSKSIGDGKQDDPDGEETLAKFKRPRRSKKAAVKNALEDIGNEAVPIDKDKRPSKDRAVQETDDIPAKIKKPRRLKKHEANDALEVDVTKATEASRDSNQNLEGNIAEDSENTLTHFKKKKNTRKSAKDLPKVASASRQASASENDIKETANTDQVSKWQRTAGSSQGSPSALVEKTRASKGAKSGKESLESNPDGAEKGSAVKASDIKKGKKQSDSQRAVRQVKKRRHGDMAYEGDSDWDVLMNGEETLDNKSNVDKERLGRGRNRAGLFSSMLSQVVPGEEAAVAAGLKVRQPGPAEKIKFKDVLKRRGGLQEYLECRNSILWLWDKDVRRILPLSDCGVSSVPLPDEPPRDALIRDVYKFLDYHGYINVGVAVKKPKTKDDFEPKLKLSKESMQTENCGDKVADAEEEVAFILGQIKVSEENLSPGQNQVQVEGEKQVSLLNVEDVKRNKLAENCSGLMDSGKKDSEECGVALMEIDETPLVVPHTAENTIAEAAKSSVVKSEVQIESTVAHEDSEELGTRNTSGSGGTEGEVFLEKDDGVKVEVDPLIKVHSALDQIKNSYGEDEFSDIDSAKVLHNLRKHDLQVDLQTEKQEAKLNGVSEANDANSTLEGQKRIIVIGGGPAGLAAARHLQRLNCHVTVLEARDRVGGRVHTDRSALSVPVDLGASIITGVEADVATERRPDPSALLCTQLGLELTVLNSDCPLYDSVTGQKVPANLDESLEAEYNSLLDDMVMLVAQNGDVAMRMSLEEGLEYALKKRRIARSSSSGSELASSKALLNDPDSSSIIQDSSVGALDALGATVDSRLNVVSENNISVVAGIENGISMESQPDKLNLMGNSSMEQQSLSPLERRVMDWHFANLEYGCAAELSRVSLPYWNQDDAYGGFGGAHCMIKGGYSTVMEALAEGLNIQLGHIVTEISYSTKDPKSKGGINGEVKVWTENSQEFVGDAVLITVPLGCLKANAIKFSPALPDWKLASIQQLGFGVLNKVIMEFPKVFWDESVDYFGATAESIELRGRCFMFWNLKKTVGAPVLIALVVGKAAIDGQNLETSDHVKHAVKILRKLFGETAVPDPIASVATNWGSDPFSRGAYSYVAVGASGEDYDILGRPVENCLFFAGEATCKEHPDTVGGAMMSGLREAVRIIDILENRVDSMAEAEAMAAEQRHSDSERNEVRDMVKRLDAGELSSVLCKGSLDGEQKPLSKDALLQDMFGNAKTTAGRLFLAKKMLQLPAAVKAFAGTKEGLSILNNWILDSMGKDGTQLLRHCVRLLLIVSTDMIAVRQSGIGRTVKEKVCVHTSRDIRAVASQLVKMWIEVFRKEKANGGFKLLKQLHGSATNPGSSDVVKAKSKEQSSGKPFATAANDVKGNTDQSPSTPINKNPALHSVQVEEGSEQKKEANSVGAQISDQGQPKKPEVCALSELEAAAIAAEEAARAAAAAAAEAYATSEAECSTFRELPKIPSFHKFARREQYVQKEDSDVRKRKWSGAVLGKQDCSSEIDSRSCRVRNWSVDFAATCGNLDSSRLASSDFGSGNILPPTDSNKKQRSHSNDVDSHSDLKERSAETGTVDSKSTKNRVQNSGSVSGVKIPDSRANQQPYSLGSHLEVFDQSIQKLNEKCSSKIEQICIGKARHGNDNKGVAEAGPNRGSPGTRNGHKDEARGAEHIKKGITDYIASLLMPLYKTKKIDRDGYKSIMKKSTIKVMEHNTPAENAMTVSEFLDCKRRNKIRSLVDKFIEKHLASTQL